LFFTEEGEAVFRDDLFPTDVEENREETVIGCDSTVFLGDYPECGGDHTTGIGVENEITGFHEISWRSDSRQ